MGQGGRSFPTDIWIETLNFFPVLESSDFQYYCTCLQGIDLESYSFQAENPFGSAPLRAFAWTERIFFQFRRLLATPRSLS